MVDDVDVIIVGAGFAGLYALHHFRDLGLTVVVLEAGMEVGGTWYWNRYPGARCDVESVDYSYAFSPALEQEWTWTERYASQPEILAYAKHVADIFDLRRDIRFGQRVVSACFDEKAIRWELATTHGDILRSRFCVMATGCLSVPRVPDIPGRDRFVGVSHHTSFWPTDFDVSGRRVACIGTGSSGIQASTALAPLVDELFVMQRTPNFSVPSRNRPLPIDESNAIKAAYPARRRSAAPSKPANKAVDVTEEERNHRYEERWQAGGAQFLSAFSDILFDETANTTAADFVRSKIRATVADPKVAEALCPSDHPFGTKRLCVDTDYYDIFNRSNVTLVDLRKEPITEITETGVRTTGGGYDVDAIVFATGFDAMTGAVLGIDPVGVGGVRLREKWADGPETYLGLGVAGFPNLFLVTGPGSPSVLENMIRAVEQHVEWIGRCLVYLRRRHIRSIEPSVQAEADWVDHVNTLASATLFPRANSWWVGANIPGKPRVFMPYVAGIRRYQKALDDVAANHYQGFLLDGLESVSRSA